jgi:predicted Zn-dependent protease
MRDQPMSRRENMPQSGYRNDRDDCALDWLYWCLLLGLAFALTVAPVQATAAGPGAQWYNEYLEKDLLYPDTEWQDYVTDIGERLLAVTPHRGKTYTFVVTDQPFVNASATPDAYIFVTRGIIAQFQSEDELAGVIGHEIGHVVASHSARARRTNRLGTLLSYLGTFATGSNSMYGLSRNVTAMITAEYGREHELEADELGTGYLIKAGYNPQGLLDSMYQTSSYENFQRTVKNQPVVYRGITSSHPATMKRINDLIVQSNHLLPDELPEPERDFFEMINGMTYGDEAATGIVKDGVFYHGALRLTVKFPSGWDVRSTSNEVFGVPPRGGAQINLKRQSPPESSQTPLEYLTETLRRDDLEHGEEIQVGPYVGYMADVKVASGNAQARKIAVIYKDGGVYLFNGELGPIGDVATFATEFENTVRSLRSMTGDDLRQVNTQKIKIIFAKPGDTYAKLARRVSLSEYAEETLRLINGDHPRGEPRAGDPIKIIQ